MPVPGLREWQSRWERPEHRALGLRGEAIEAGYARLAVERPEGADELLLRSAITVAADIAAISAVQARLGDGEQANGTAELHCSFVGPLPAAARVEARVIHWAAYSAHLELEARGPDGELVARGLTTYSLRPAPPAAGAGA